MVKKLFNSSSTISTESIIPQTNKELFTDLVNTITKIRDRPLKSNDRLPEITKTILKHTNLYIDVIIGKDMEVNIAIPMIPNASPFTRALESNYEINTNALSKVFEKKKKASVNPTTCKVDGFFKLLKCQIFIGKDIITPGEFVPDNCFPFRLLDEEIAGLILHEVGHAFIYCYYLDKIYTTNQVLCSAFKICDGNYNASEKKYYLSLATDALKVNITSDRLPVDSPDMTTAVIAAAPLHRNSELNSDEYDLTSYEQMADQFATRCGGGLFVGSALVKLERIHSNGMIANNKEINDSLAQSRLLTLCFSAVNKISTEIGKGMAFVSLLSKNLKSVDSKLMYDDLITRIKRIKEDLIQQLKLKTKLPDYYISDLLFQIKELDLMIKELEKKESLFRKVMNIIIHNGLFNPRDAQFKIQRQLEELSANDLHYYAALFKNM
jgi:hypothetical protein